MHGVVNKRRGGGGGSGGAGLVCARSRLLIFTKTHTYTHTHTRAHTRTHDARTSDAGPDPRLPPKNMPGSKMIVWIASNPRVSVPPPPRFISRVMRSTTDVTAQ